MKQRLIRVPLCVLLGCVVAGAAVLSGCGALGKRKVVSGTETKTASCEPGQQGKSLTLALSLTPQTFNPFLDANPATYEVTRNLFGTLLDYNAEKGRVEETGLASAVNAEGDGRTYTIRLRKCFFSDGQTPVSAEDVAYSFKMAMNADIASSLGDVLRVGDQDTKCDAKDPSTVAITFPVTYAADLARLVLARVPIVNKKSFEAAAARGAREAYGYDTAPEGILCSGPFKIGSKTPAELVLQANPAYWKVDSAGTLLPYVNEVRFRLNIDRKGQTDLFNSGQVDVIDAIAPDSFKQFQGNAKVTVRNAGGSLRVWALVLNMRTDPTKVDANKSKHFLIPAFRLAMSQAINREQLVQTAAAGSAKPAYNLLSPGDTTWFDTTVKTWPYSIDQAKIYLAEAQYKLDGDRLVDPLDLPVRFSLLYPKDTVAAAMAKNIVTDLKALGITVAPDEKDAKDWWRMVSRGAYDAALVEIQPDFPDPAFLRTFVLGGRIMFAEPGPKGSLDIIRKLKWYVEVEKAFTEAMSKKSTAERKEQYNLFQAKWGEQSPSIYLISEDTLVGAKTTIGNLRFTAADPGASWNLEELYVK